MAGVVNTETPKPQPGDRVRATLPDVDGVLVAADGQGVQLRTDDGTIHHFPGADIRVLERADDPSKALRGEVREIDGMPAVCYGKDFWVYFSYLHGDSTGGYGVYRDEQMVGTPVVGVVPGTPAAEAADRQKRRVVLDPQGLGERLWRDLNRYAGQGDLNAAAGVLSLHTTMSSDEAIAYVRDMSEYQTYLAARGETRGPREFAKDGPEPPSEVTVLVDRGDPRRMPFLLRSGDGWVWSMHADRIETDDTTPRPWVNRGVTAVADCLLEVV